MRISEIHRVTSESNVKIIINIDGTGKKNISTGIPFLNHMIEQIALHGQFDIEIQAKGDIDIDYHHTVEDIGITLGMALKKSIGYKSGINRYGYAYIPLDESLSRVVVDLSGRPGLYYKVDFKRSLVGKFDVDLIKEFFQGLVNHALLTLHIDNIKGDNVHHQIETIFKAFGRSLKMAVAVDEKIIDLVPSTKGIL
ncbi:Histidine biosynthesis bifunctional protein HisB [Candidatus Kinetoplastibacterium sorsogonicusi]|uniref:Imidazoleglycerol-phosphate dehydratase n=1 Tax=Candidatus Kinetoplastidibacterium kentomonadis TaxID=1576550 RepID=A0A3Q8F608_9PROT|nr:imidazoleglycerol-phosphate dehydratase HisB [Candidatus Kinetoplastibacterium sorsogonicusi]AWD32168.1 Histidine biosynthesis bifunctional protein HisB [Candidatus Kinetoplastibacterium sorsogonicusi]